MKIIHGQSARGFTLIELLVVISIFGIMSAFAVPYFQDILSSKDINTARNTLLYSLNKAKRIASAENTFVDISLEDNTIQLLSLNSGKSEIHKLPENITFPDKQEFTFSANGLVVSEDGVSLNSDTQVLIQHKSISSKQDIVSISTTGLVAVAE